MAFQAENESYSFTLFDSIFDSVNMLPMSDTNQQHSLQFEVMDLDEIINLVPEVFKSYSLESWSNMSSISEQPYSHSSINLLPEVFKSDSLESWSTMSSTSEQPSSHSEQEQPQLQGITSLEQYDPRFNFAGSVYDSQSSNSCSPMSFTSKQLDSYSDDLYLQKEKPEVQVIPPLEQYHPRLNFIGSELNSSGISRGSIPTPSLDIANSSGLENGKKQFTITSSLDFRSDKGCEIKESFHIKSQKQTIYEEERTVHIVEGRDIEEPIHKSQKKRTVKKKTTRVVQIITEETSNSIIEQKDGSNKFACTVCDKVFITKMKLKRHAKRHSQPRLQCPNCKKAFHHNSDLKRHVRIHTGIKPYKCKFCDKVFAQKIALNGHLRVHGVEQDDKGKILYICEDCGVSTNDAKEHYFHLKENHPNSPLLEKVYDRRYFKFTEKPEDVEKLLQQRIER